MPILEATGSDFERIHIPAKTYKATLVAVKDGTIPDMDKPGERKNVLFWAFEIHGKERTVTVEGMTTTSFYGDKSKARKWVKALMNQEPPTRLDTDDLLGSPCRIVVVDKGEGDGVFSRVENVISAEEGEL